MGSASIISPTVQGIVSRKASRMPRESSLRNAGRLPTATRRESSGSVTVPIATPNSPSGSCISRNAIANQKIGPSPRCEAKIELISTLNCVVLAAMTDGPMSESTAATPGSRHLKSGW